MPGGSCELCASRGQRGQSKGDLCMCSGQGEGLWQRLQLCCAREPRATGNKGRLWGSLSFPVPAASMAHMVPV